jgi:hypothetical protein
MKKNIDRKPAWAMTCVASAAARPSIRKIRERDERITLPSLGHHECHQEHDGAGELGDRAGRAPAGPGRVDDRVDQEQQAARPERRTGQIEVTTRGGLAIVVEKPERSDDHEHRDRHVDEEHRTPTGPLRQDPSKRDAQGRGQRHRRAPDTQRFDPVTALGERGREDRKGGGGHHRRAEALGQTSGNEHRIAAGKSTGER